MFKWDTHTKTRRKRPTMSTFMNECSERDALDWINNVFFLFILRIAIYIELCLCGDDDNDDCQSERRVYNADDIYYRMLILRSGYKILCIPYLEFVLVSLAAAALLLCIYRVQLIRHK